MIKMLTKTTDGKTQDLGNLIRKVTWSGKREGAPRKVVFTTYPILNFEITNGQPVTFYEDDEPLFAGYIFKNKPDDEVAYTVTCYDQVIYLTKNKEVYLLANVTATEVLETIGQDFQLNLASPLIDTQHVIKTIIQENKQLYDVVSFALTETLAQTGNKYYIRDNLGRIELVDTFTEIQIPDNYIIRIPIERSIENTATRVRTVVRNKGTRTSVVADEPELQTKWGVLQAYKTLDKDINFAQQVERTKELLEELSVEGEKVQLECIGINGAISGNSVNINGIGSFFIDEDSHTYEGDTHIMKLTLKRR